MLVLLRAEQFRRLSLQLKLTDMIDGLWTRAVEKADLAGKEMARVRAEQPLRNEN